MYPSIPIIGYIIWILVYPIFYLKVLFPYSLHFLTPWLIVWETKISHMIRYLVFLNYFPGVTYLRKLVILILLCHICFLHCKAAIENVGFNIRDKKWLQDKICRHYNFGFKLYGVLLKIPYTHRCTSMLYRQGEKNYKLIKS